MEELRPSVLLHFHVQRGFLFVPLGLYSLGILCSGFFPAPGKVFFLSSHFQFPNPDLFECYISLCNKPSSLQRKAGVEAHLKVEDL